MSGKGYNSIIIIKTERRLPKTERNHRRPPGVSKQKQNINVAPRHPFSKSTKCCATRGQRDKREIYYIKAILQNLIILNLIKYDQNIYRTNEYPRVSYANYKREETTEPIAVSM